LLLWLLLLLLLLLAALQCLYASCQAVHAERRQGHGLGLVKSATVTAAAVAPAAVAAAAAVVLHVLLVCC
jgi:hypothetical protein